MQFVCTISRSVLLVGCLVWLSACSHEVGSDQWCAEMKKKPKQEWTAQEAGDYAKYCILKLEKK